MGKLRERRRHHAPSTAQAPRPRSQVVKAVGTHKPGDTVTIGFDRARASEERRRSSRGRPQGQEGAAHRGACCDRRSTSRSRSPTTSASRIGGPSAGTMFALAIYDRLTPGLAHRRPEGRRHRRDHPDGTVGPIGGIRQKIAGAADDGAKIFLVPAANCAEATDGDDHGMQAGQDLQRSTTRSTRSRRWPRTPRPRCRSASRAADAARGDPLPSTPCVSSRSRSSRTSRPRAGTSRRGCIASCPPPSWWSANPALADQLSAQLEAQPDGFTSIEQDGLPPDRPLEELLAEIEWPDAVAGCVAVVERIMLPPEAEDDRCPTTRTSC